MGTGVGFLPGRLMDARAVELGELCGDCEPWNAQVLHAGKLGALPVWLLEDVSDEPLLDEPASPWVRAMPVWLAAAAGGAVLIALPFLLPYLALAATGDIPDQGTQRLNSLYALSSYLPRRSVQWRGMPLATWILALGGVLGGSVIVESVLGRQGLGTLMVSAVRARDLPLVMGIVLFTSTAVWLGNAIGELLQAINDKRIRDFGF